MCGARGRARRSGGGWRALRLGARGAVLRRLRRGKEKPMSCRGGHAHVPWRPCQRLASFPLVSFPSNTSLACMRGCFVPASEVWTELMPEESLEFWRRDRRREERSVRRGKANFASERKISQAERKKDTTCADVSFQGQSTRRKARVQGRDSEVREGECWMEGRSGPMRGQESRKQGQEAGRIPTGRRRHRVEGGAGLPVGHSVTRLTDFVAHCGLLEDLARPAVEAELAAHGLERGCADAKLGGSLLERKVAERLKTSKREDDVVDRA
eukprot:123699-Rhodomonas_salina.2